MNTVQKVSVFDESTIDLPAPEKPIPGKRELSAKRTLKGRINITLFSVLIFSALVLGWNIRDEYFINAEYGTGYLLGILGGTMMLLLLIYPLRKHFGKTRFFIFSTPTWFRLHMTLGFLGPICILYHCNFSLGSTNSNVALLSMLMMVSSGLFGRFIYSRIHMGIYGKKAHLKGLMAHKLSTLNSITSTADDGIVNISERTLTEISRSGDRFQDQEKFQGIVQTAIKTRKLQRVIVGEIRQQNLHNETFQSLTRRQRTRQLKRVNKFLTTYFSIIRKMVGLNFFERLFSLWHLMHMPIFLMLIASSLVHVYAVHAY